MQFQKWPKLSSMREVRVAHAIDADLAGDREAISAYCERLEEIRSAYVINHRSIYSGEQRRASGGGPLRYKGV